MRRLNASATLFLTAFFAVAGSYHHHSLPKPTHDHAGLCSEPSAAATLESCAICRATHVPAEGLTRVAAAPVVDPVASHEVLEAASRSSAGASLHADSRAPPIA